MDRSATGASDAQNIAVIRRGYEAFGKGDITTLKTLFSPNANWRQAEAGWRRAS
jgi:ketosteroid isomerase-like protein